MQFSMFEPRTDFFNRPLWRLLESGMTPWRLGHEAPFTLRMGYGWNEDALNLRFIMPAVEDKDFTVQVKGNQLTVRGERRTPENFAANGDTCYTLRYGKFERVVDLPSGLNLDDMKANLHHGVLDIQIPFTESAKVRSIPVTSAEMAMAAA